MREEMATAVRYDPNLGRNVVVRLTYAVGEGPRPDIVRWFLIKEEVQRLQESQTLVGRVDPSPADLNRERGATPKLQPEAPLGPLPPRH
jgi:hypothetical protein